MKLRCYLLSLLRIHPPDCEHCKARDKCGVEMRERLEELNGRTEPYSINNGNHAEVVQVFDSRSAEVALRPISLEQLEKKAG